MYQEYAIDPTTICRSFDRFKLVWNGLGYSEGRVLSRFPGSWEKKVIKSQAYKDLPDGLRKKLIEDSLANEAKVKRKSIASGRDYDSNTPSWLEEAENAHASAPFCGILAEGNPREHASVVTYDELGDTEDCWTVPRPWQVMRYRRAMAAAAAPLLRASRDILFIEPYFKFSPRFTKPMQAFLAELVPFERVINRLEIHLKHWDDESNEATFQSDFEQAVADKLRYCCPRGGEKLLKKLEFFIWESSDSNRMHPRYILTEVAGLGFENGLDESDDGGGLTDVSIVAGDSLQTRWNEFQMATVSRRLVSRIKVRD